jgi:hypothetical protein
MLHKYRILGDNTLVAGSLQNEESHTSSRMSIATQGQPRFVDLKTDNSIDNTQTSDDVTAGTINEDSHSFDGLGCYGQVGNELRDRLVSDFSDESDELLSILDFYRYEDLLLNILCDSGYWA